MHLLEDFTEENIDEQTNYEEKKKNIIRNKDNEEKIIYILEQHKNAYMIQSRLIEPVTIDEPKIIDEPEIKPEIKSEIKPEIINITNVSPTGTLAGIIATRSNINKFEPLPVLVGIVALGLLILRI